MDNCTFGLSDGKIVVIHPKTNAEKEMVSELFFGGTSYGNLKISSLSFSAVRNKADAGVAGSESEEGEPNGSILISVSISFNEKVLWSGSLSVRPINGLTVK